MWEYVVRINSLICELIYLVGQFVWLINEERHSRGRALRRLNRSKGVQMNCPPRATQPPIPADDQWFYPFLSMITKVIKFLRTDPNAAFHTKQAVDPKFQKRRSLDHLLLKWSPMVPSFPPWSPHQPLSRLNYDTRKLIRVQGMLIAWHGMACWSGGQSGKITRKCGALGHQA